MVWRGIIVLVASALLVGLPFVGWRYADAMPQVARGEGALAVAFGDAKDTISLAMVHKADSYFHGGVDMECHEHHHGECPGEECDGHHDEEESEGDGHVGSNQSTWFDPWGWLNVRIRAPEVERHLEGERAVEMMPWFWAAVKANPHNIDAWTTALYASSRIMKDRELSKKVIAEAKARNPDNLELLVAEGRFLYDGGHGDIEAARVVFQKVEQLARVRCGGDEGKLTENDAWMVRFAKEHLKKIGNR